LVPVAVITAVATAFLGEIAQQPLTIQGKLHPAAMIGVGARPASRGDADRGPGWRRPFCSQPG
jgi:hypothetical protein